jgi:hypothetical protein
MKLATPKQSKRRFSKAEAIAGQTLRYRQRKDESCQRLNRAYTMPDGRLLPIFEQLSPAPCPSPQPYMLDKSVPEVELLRAGYAAFNARDTDATLATMTPDVTLPNGMDGGYIHGHQAIRAYWKKQWSVIHPHDEPISFHREDSGQILVDVHQVVRDLAGTVLADRHLGHRCTIEHGLIQAIEVCPLPASGPGA